MDPPVYTKSGLSLVAAGQEAAVLGSRVPCPGSQQERPGVRRGLDVAATDLEEGNRAVVATGSREGWVGEFGGAHGGDLLAPGEDGIRLALLAFGSDQIADGAHGRSVT